MTREEAIRFGENILKVADKTTDADAIEFTEMAIEAFQQEQSGDAISRQAALASIKNLYPDMPVVDIMNARRKWLEKYAPYFECENAIEQLPSVNPQERLEGMAWMAHETNRRAVNAICKEFSRDFANNLIEQGLCEEGLTLMKSLAGESE